MDRSLLKAAREYIHRGFFAGSYRDKVEMMGYFDDNGIWYPGQSEKCDLCDGIRAKMDYRDAPLRLYYHCRTVEHISSKYGVRLHHLGLLTNLIRVHSEQRVAQIYDPLMAAIAMVERSRDALIGEIAFGEIAKILMLEKGLLGGSRRKKRARS